MEMFRRSATYAERIPERQHEPRPVRQEHGPHHVRGIRESDGGAAWEVLSAACCSCCTSKAQSVRPPPGADWGVGGLGRMPYTSIHVLYRRIRHARPFDRLGNDLVRTD